MFDSVALIITFVSMLFQLASTIAMGFVITNFANAHRAELEEVAPDEAVLAYDIKAREFTAAMREVLLLTLHLLVLDRCCILLTLDTIELKYIAPDVLAYDSKAREVTAAMREVLLLTSHLISLRQMLYITLY